MSVRKLEVGARVDDAMSALFAANTLVCLNQIYGIVYYTQGFYNLFGAGMNFADVFGGYVQAIEMATKLPKAKRHYYEKLFLVSMDFTVPTKLTAIVTTSLLAQYSILGGTLGTIFTLLGPFTFAAAIWYSFLRSSWSFYRVWKKSTPEGLKKDRSKKIENLEKRISLLQDKKNKLAELKKKLAQEEKSIEIIEKEIDKLTSQINKWRKAKGDMQLQLTVLSDEHSPMAKALLRKQEQKVQELGLRSLTWLMAAIGMTLFALTPIFPQLITLAITFMVLSSVVKVFQLLNSSVFDKLAYYLKTKNPDNKISAQQIPLSIDKLESTKQENFVELLLHGMDEQDGPIETLLSKEDEEKCVNQYAEMLSDAFTHFTKNVNQGLSEKAQARTAQESHYPSKLRMFSPSTDTTKKVERSLRSSQKLDLDDI